MYNNSPGKETTRKLIQKRVKELHTHSYLTLLSIGQAVSFHLLSEEITKADMFVPLGPDFHFLYWLLALETFILLILVWNDFFMVISIYTWIPSLLDAVILFCLFASEVCMAKTITNTNYWLISLTFFLFFSLIAFRNTYTQTKRRQENKLLFEMSKKRMILSMWLIFSLLCSLIAIILIGHNNLYFKRAGILLSWITIIAFTLAAIKHWKKAKIFIDGQGDTESK